MEIKQSSIEWLIQHFGGIKNCTPDFRYKIEQAKEMHKQEIVDAYRFGLQDEFVIGSQNYYNETFGK